MLGQNLIHEARGASGKLELVPRLMRELKAAAMDVVVTVSYPAAAAAKASGVPTVLASGSGDPVKTGLVESLAHPGGNVTGIADDASTLSTKRLSLLTALLPKLHRVAMLWNKDDLGMSMRYEASAKTAQGAGFTVQPLGVREPDDFNEAFEAMTRDPPDAILMVSDSLTLLNRKRVIDYAAAHRLPAIYEEASIVRDGGLMSYGADPARIFRSRRIDGRSHPQRYETSRPSGRAAYALPICHQFKDSEINRTRNSSDADCARGRSDRIMPRDFGFAGRAYLEGEGTQLTIGP